MILLSEKKVKLKIPPNSNLNKNVNINKTQDKTLEPIIKINKKEEIIKTPQNEIKQYPIVKDSNLKNDINKSFLEDFQKINLEKGRDNYSTFNELENFKVDQEVIKKENYYSKLREIGKNLYPIDKTFKRRIQIDCKSIVNFMPVGLVKSPNSGDLIKYNLYDEYNIDKIDTKNTKKKNEESESVIKISPKRKYSARTIEAKKNDPILKQKVLNEFISRIK